MTVKFFEKKLVESISYGIALKQKLDKNTILNFFYCIKCNTVVLNYTKFSTRSTIVQSAYNHHKTRLIEEDPSFDLFTTDGAL